jgi:hypothetical protein
MCVGTPTLLKACTGTVHYRLRRLPAIPPCPRQLVALHGWAPAGRVDTPACQTLPLTIESWLNALSRGERRGLTPPL